MQDFYTENYETLKKIRGDLSKWKDYVHGLEDLISLKQQYFLNWSTIPIKIQYNHFQNSNFIFCKNGQADTKNIYRNADPEYPKQSYKRQGTHTSSFPNLQQSYCLLCGSDLRHQWMITESPEINIHLWSVDFWQLCQHCSMVERRVFSTNTQKLIQNG